MQQYDIRVPMRTTSVLHCTSETLHYLVCKLLGGVDLTSLRGSGSGRNEREGSFLVQLEGKTLPTLLPQPDIDCMPSSAGIRCRRDYIRAEDLQACRLD